MLILDLSSLLVWHLFMPNHFKQEYKSSVLWQRENHDINRQCIRKNTKPIISWKNPKAVVNVSMGMIILL
jgi:hypothetical protein